MVVAMDVCVRLMATFEACGNEAGRWRTIATGYLLTHVFLLGEGENNREGEAREVSKALLSASSLHACGATDDFI